MAQFLVTIPDEEAVRILTDMCTAYKYQPMITGEDGSPVSNPQSPQDFMIEQKIKWIKETMKFVELPDLSKADKITRTNEINAINITIEVVT